MGYISFDVKCPSCGEIFFETTEAFDPHKMTTGEMLRFKKQYGPGGYNWSMPFSDYDMAEALVCAECGGSLAPSGKVKVEPLMDGDFILDGSFQVGSGVDAGNPVEVKEISGSEILKRQEEAFDALEAFDLDDLDDGAIKFGEESMILNGKPPEEDPLVKYTTLISCPECGCFYNLDEWEIHLAKHSPEEREEILRQPEPVRENPPVAEEPPRGKKARKKNTLPEADEKDKKLYCPFCEAGYDNEVEYQNHVKGHKESGAQPVQN